jgi:hypothetical protein
VASAFSKIFPFDLRRLQGVFVVATGGIAIFVALHFVLTYALGADAAPIYPRQRPLGWALHEKIWGRVAAIDRLYHRGQLKPDTRLGIYIGVSTTAAGIKREILDARATGADRWIVLSGAGLSFENIENVMLPVFYCSLKPTTVVFGVHPQMLVGERYIDVGDDPELRPRGVVGRRARTHKSRFQDLPVTRWLGRHWVIRHHALIDLFLRTPIYGVRLWVFHATGVSAEWLAAPAIQPWDEDPLELWNLDDMHGKFAEAQLDFWARRGHFEAANYNPDGDGAHSIVRMIRAFREMGADVYVVIMPLRSIVRNTLPRVAKPCLLEVLQNSIPEDPPTIIDLAEAMPDWYFLDEAHLSKSGAERLSKMVAERLQAKPNRRHTGDGS